MRLISRSTALVVLGFAAGAVAVAVLYPPTATQTASAPDHTRGRADAPAAATAGFADAVAKASPTVVKVFGLSSRDERLVASARVGRGILMPARNDRGTAQPPMLRLGSGVIVDASGLIVSNGHVVRGLSKIEVELVDGRRAPATLLGIDDATDLAVLRVPLTGLPAIEIGDPAQLRIGDVVLAIGNPYGIGQAVSLGIVSGTGRSELGLTPLEDFIQTDAAINPGNSGGALVDVSGRLVGIATAGVTGSGHSEGVGFAIPSTLVSVVVNAYAEHGRLDRGWIGLRGESVDRMLETRFGLRTPSGVLVWSTEENGPAEAADIRPGDVITAFAGEAVDNAGRLSELITATAPGTRVELVIFRGSERLERHVQTAEWDWSGQVSARSSHSLRQTNSLERAHRPTEVAAPRLGDRRHSSRERACRETGYDC
jgi:S1-C subfamily serine protease